MAYPYNKKENQIKPHTFESFDIKITSKYGKANEIFEMINFTVMAADKNVTHYVKELFYDSDIGACGIDVKAVVEPEDIVGIEISNIAKKQLKHFILFGNVVSP